MLLHLRVRKSVLRWWTAIVRSEMAHVQSILIHQSWAGRVIVVPERPLIVLGPRSFHCLADEDRQ
jgi:hypothetical protein